MKLKFLTLSAALLAPFSVAANETAVNQVELYAGLAENTLVTATRLPRAQTDIAGTVSVISAQDISRQVAADLDDLVRYQPGLSMNTAGRGGNQGFVIRGVGGNRVLTLIDGVRSNDIYEAGPASYGRDSYEVDDLKSVEVIRGPASVLYGADALGGVVLLTTKAPQDYIAEGEEHYFSGRLGYSGANDEAKLGFTAATQQEKFGLIAQFTHREFSESEIKGGAKLNPQDGKSDALLLKAVVDTSAQHRLTFALDAVTESIDYELLSDLSASVTQSQAHDETDRLRLSLKHHWAVEQAMADHVETQLYWQNTEALQNTVQQRTSFSFFSSPFGTQAKRDTDFEFNQEVRGLAATAVKSFETGSVEHALVYGFSYEATDTERPRNRCETNLSTQAVTCNILAFPFSGAESFPNKTFPDTETTRTGVFVQDEWVLGDTGVTLIPGIRFDRYEMNANTSGLVPIGGFDVRSFSESNTSLSVGGLYELTEQVTLFAQYAEGFRPPNFEEANQSFVNLNFNYATVPNPNLKPESSTGVELGVKADFETVFLSLALFQNDYKDFIDTQFVGQNGAISLFQDVNIGEATIEGAELLASWQVSDTLSGNIAIAYAHGDDETAGQPLNSVEPLTGVLGFEYTAADNRWALETAVTLVKAKDRVSDPSRVTAGGYGVVDVFGHYDVNDAVRLRLGIFNVFDKQYAKWTNIEGLLATSSGIATSQEAGTEVRISMDVRF